MDDNCAGYKQKVVELEQSGEMKPPREGQMALTFPSYSSLASCAREEKIDFSTAVFAQLILVLCWNLLVRCVSVFSIMFTHISWEQDSMVISLPMNKGEEVDVDRAKKHIYANPACPDICPVLAMAVYIWCMGMRRENSSPLLFGDRIQKSDQRFRAWLLNILGQKGTDLALLGIDITEVGTHSIRKGIAAFLSGRGIATSHTEGSSGNRLCGRAASGLCITDPEFAALPPHFALTGDGMVTAAEWEEVLPGYTTSYPDNFKRVLPYLLASLVHHRAYLRTKLPAGHPLFHCKLWTTNKIEQLAPRVHAGHNKNPVTGLTATGIP